MRINGKVQSGFEPVRELFTRSLTSKRDRNAQLCVYVGENRVVDLWATSGAEPFSPDSLVNVFSSGKSIECILLAMLADQGLLNFAERVATYWPEFVGTQKHKDKDRLTVADVMRHEAGLASLNITLSPEQLTASALKQSVRAAPIAFSWSERLTAGISRFYPWLDRQRNFPPSGAHRQDHGRVFARRSQFALGNRRLL